jgi:hypothetical protein
MSSPTEAKANGIYEQERDTRVGSLRGCDGRRVDVMPARSAAHPGGDVFGAETQALYLVFNLVAGVLENNIAGGLGAEINAMKAKEGKGDPPREGKYPTDPKNPLVQYLAYKARPLNGIWATAPFLHNGSVPTLLATRSAGPSSST